MDVVMDSETNGGIERRVKYRVHIYIRMYICIDI